MVKLILFLGALCWQTASGSELDERLLGYMHNQNWRSAGMVKVPLGLRDLNLWSGDDINWDKEWVGACTPGGLGVFSNESVSGGMVSFTGMTVRAVGDIKWDKAMNASITSSFVENGQQFETVKGTVVASVDVKEVSLDASNSPANMVAFCARGKCSCQQVQASVVLELVHLHIEVDVEIALSKRDGRVSSALLSGVSVRLLDDFRVESTTVNLVGIGPNVTAEHRSAIQSATADFVVRIHEELESTNPSWVLKTGLLSPDLELQLGRSIEAGVITNENTEWSFSASTIEHPALQFCSSQLELQYTDSGSLLLSLPILVLNQANADWLVRKLQDHEDAPLEISVYRLYVLGDVRFNIPMKMSIVASQVISFPHGKIISPGSSISFTLKDKVSSFGQLTFELNGVEPYPMENSQQRLLVDTTMLVPYKLAEKVVNQATCKCNSERRLQGQIFDQNFNQMLGIPFDGFITRIGGPLHMENFPFSSYIRDFCPTPDGRDPDPFLDGWMWNFDRTIHEHGHISRDTTYFKLALKVPVPLSRLQFNRLHGGTLKVNVQRLPRGATSRFSITNRDGEVAPGFPLRALVWGRDTDLIGKLLKLGRIAETVWKYVRKLSMDALGTYNNATGPSSDFMGNEMFLPLQKERANIQTATRKCNFNEHSTGAYLNNDYCEYNFPVKGGKYVRWSWRPESNQLSCKEAGLFPYGLGFATSKKYLHEKSQPFIDLLFTLPGGFNDISKSLTDKYTKGDVVSGADHQEGLSYLVDHNKYVSTFRNDVQDFWSKTFGEVTGTMFSTLILSKDSFGSNLEPLTGVQVGHIKAGPLLMKILRSSTFASSQVAAHNGAPASVNVDSNVSIQFQARSFRPLLECAIAVGGIKRYAMSSWKMLNYLSTIVSGPDSKALASSEAYLVVKVHEQMNSVLLRANQVAIDVPSFSTKTYLEGLDKVGVVLADYDKQVNALVHSNATLESRKTTLSDMYLTAQALARTHKTMYQQQVEKVMGSGEMTLLGDVKRAEAAYKAQFEAVEEAQTQLRLETERYIRELNKNKLGKQIMQGLQLAIQIGTTLTAGYTGVKNFWANETLSYVAFAAFSKGVDSLKETDLGFIMKGTINSGQNGQLHKADKLSKSIGYRLLIGSQLVKDMEYSLELLRTSDDIEVLNIGNVSSPSFAVKKVAVTSYEIASIKALNHESLAHLEEHTDAGVKRAGLHLNTVMNVFADTMGTYSTYLDSFVTAASELSLSLALYKDALQGVSEVSKMRMEVSNPAREANIVASITTILMQANSIILSYMRYLCAAIQYDTVTDHCNDLNIEDLSRAIIKERSLGASLAKLHKLQLDSTFDLFGGDMKRSTGGDVKMVFLNGPIPVKKEKDTVYIDMSAQFQSSKFLNESALSHQLVCSSDPSKANSLVDPFWAFVATKLVRIRVAIKGGECANSWVDVSLGHFVQQRNNAGQVLSYNMQPFTIRVNEQSSFGAEKDKYVPYSPYTTWNLQILKGNKCNLEMIDSVEVKMTFIGDLRDGKTRLLHSTRH
mmetsp:Transcript_7616/g.14012  ORF Transcript_7616/g.14012 Transcript_7616/m.14012 type:complete len:1523 (-) Transcript_7616:74-4642(-)